MLADLQNVTAANVSKNPIMLADLLKFILTFRNQLPKEAYAVMFPILNVLLSSQVCLSVCFSYAHFPLFGSQLCCVVDITLYIHYGY